MTPEIPRYMQPQPVYPVAPGSVPPPPVVSLGNVGHQRYTVTVPAGAGIPISADGDFFRVEYIRSGQYISSSAYLPSPPIPLVVIPDGTRQEIPIFGPGSFSHFPRAFKRLQINNPNTTDCILIVWIGFGFFDLPLTRTAPLYGSASATVVAGAGGAYAVSDAVGAADGTASNKGLFTGLCPDGFRGIVIRRAILKCGSYVAATNVKAWIYNSDAFPAFVDNALAPVYGTYGQGVQISFPSLLSAWTGATTFGLSEWNGLDLCINRGLNNGNFMFGLTAEGVFTNNNATYALELGVEFR